MTWTPVQTAQEKTGSGTSANVSFGLPVGSGNVVVGYFFYTTSLTNVAGPITDNQSNSYAIADFIGDNTINFSIGIFWGGPFLNGPTTVTVPVSVSQGVLWIGIDEFSTPAGTIALDGHATGETLLSPNPCNTGNFTTTGTGDLVYSACVSNGNTVGTGFTGLQGASNFNSEYLIQGSPGSTAGLWTVAAGGAGGSVALALSAIVPGSTTDVGGSHAIFRIRDSGWRWDG